MEPPRKSSKDILVVAQKAIGFALKTNRNIFLLVVLFNLFQGAVVFLQFTSFSAIVDEIVLIRQGASSLRDLLPPSVILGLSFLAPTLLGNVTSFYRSKFRLEQDMYLNMHKVEKQSNLDVGTIESSSYQNLLRSAQEWGTGSVLDVQEFVFTSALNFAGITTSIVILWSLSPWLVLFALLAAAPVYFVYKKFSMEVFRIRYFSLDDQRIMANRLSHFEQLHKAIDVILLKLKSWLKFQIGDHMSSFNKKIVAAERRKFTSFALLSLWYLCFLFAAVALMTFKTINNSIALGGLILAFNSYSRFYQTVISYVESVSFSEEAMRYAGLWFDLFDLQPKISSSENALRIKLKEPPTIEFRNVSFRYPSTDRENSYVVKDLSFVIHPGEKVGIVGVNGSGKTTMIKLLCRVYDPTSGSILINGIDLKEIHLEDWHDSIGVLFQDFPIYNVTIAESIGMGRIAEKVDATQLLQSSKFSGTDEFITSYDQLIWKEFKNGIDLSKGQHQRIAVARMFYRNAPLTILDEPTAAIDVLTEEKIFTSLEKNMEGKTVILITHRFSSIKNADKILMLERGQIIEQGTHHELMKLNGKYENLYTMQAKRYLEADVKDQIQI